MVKKRGRVPIKEAAERLGVSVQTMYNWKNIGRYKDRLKFRKTPFGGVYIPEGVLERFVEWYND